MPKKFETIEERREYNRAYYHRSSEEQRQRIKDRHTENKHKSREYIRSLKDSLKCYQCGEDHIAVLDFHHLDPLQKDGNVSTAWANGWSTKKIDDEIAKCVVLCSNCHRKHHWLERNDPTYSGIA